MKTINLKRHLLILIIAIGIGCLLLTSLVVLYKADMRFEKDTLLFAESVDKELELQLLRLAVNFGNPYNFPNFDVWRDYENGSGYCIKLIDNNGALTRSLCRGVTTRKNWPDWFETMYQWILEPGKSISRPIVLRKKQYGTLKVSHNKEVEISRAWQDIIQLMGLSIFTITSLCILIYFAIDYSLRPAKLIISELDKMTQGNLSDRLPDFKITEWQQTRTAINHLADSLERTRSDRKNLALKLVNVQENERRHLSRELHDEFGQSLTGLSAIAASITQTAKNGCPDLIEDGREISHITTHMMELLRNILQRLRPAELDMLGFIESLNSLVSGWNHRSKGEIKFELQLTGDLNSLPDPIPVNIFRIIQECITNISKHSGASHATITLKRDNHYKINNSVSEENVSLIITDNGTVDENMIIASTGIGLLGINERVIALGGEIAMQRTESGGLEIRILLPIDIDLRTEQFAPA